MDELMKRIKALGDPFRLRTLHLLMRCGECCVCEIQDTLHLTAPTASRNLKILEEAGWVSKRRDGRWMHYRLRDQSDERWQMLLSQVIDPLKDQPDAQEDLVQYRLRLDNSRMCTIQGLHKNRSASTSGTASEQAGREAVDRLERTT